MTAFVPLLCYLIGSLPFGLIVGKVTRGVDIRQFGSGNIGFTNALRTLGWRPALTVLLADIAKGIIAVMFSRAALETEGWAVAGGLAGIAGHNWSVFLKFQGGRGIATSFGVLVGLVPGVALAVMGVWFVTLAATRYVSLASLLAACSVPVWMFVFDQSVILKVLGGVIPLFAVVRHVPNIKRLMAGTEPKWGQKVEVTVDREKGERGEAVSSEQ
jgi:glycerol-3-phosphate acyltransferase PlsY